MSKFIIITGGVVSGLGKGITLASIGLLLKSAGLSVDAVKFDPYLNIDPGTMSPFEHGEVYVLEDGSETDLDLGHYERFLDVNLTTNSSVTAGKIYDKILAKERDGDYLGKNVQLIPHVTNYIKECFVQGLGSDVRLIEVGGSTGDMEAEIFLESYRQFRREHRQNVLHIHLGYVPYLDCSGEFKSKPLQNSVRELLRVGLQPDIIVARYTPEGEQHVPVEILNKIALFGNLPSSAVIALPDFSSIYEVPKYLSGTPMVQNLQTFLGQEIKPKLSDFFEKTGKVQNPTQKIIIVIVGKYAAKLGDADYSLQQSIKIAAFSSGVEVETLLLDAEKFENSTIKDLEWDKLKSCDAIIVPGGFGKRGMEGKIKVAQYARENKIPYLGICLGLQMAAIEFARNVLNMDAYTSEMFDSRADMTGKEIVIDYIPEQLGIHKKGGTMRLGGYSCDLVPGTLAVKLYGKTSTMERHRHRLEVQATYIQAFEQHGFKVSGKHELKVANKESENFLVEIMELDQNIHPFYMGIQSHPEFLSRPNYPHPLFKGLIEACKK